MKHTKGEWFYDHGVIENGEHIICQMNDIGYKVQADASLIAAAPDMYEALKAALKLLKEQYQIVIGVYPDYGKVEEIEMLTKALAKAEDREEGKE